jgi:molecular chaperone GrpE
MTDNGTRSAAEPEIPVSEAPADSAANPAPESSQALPEPDPVEALKAENAALKDRLLRTLAEMENLRKRTEREKAEATLYAASNFARDILNVPDSLSRALAAVPPQEREKADEAVRNLLAGVEVTERELLNVFQRHGIRRIDPEGEKFDPHLHQAMFEVPNDSVPPGTVVQVVQPGYAIGERLLRPALVGVSKAG